MINPLKDSVRIDISCNSDCTTCCPRKLKFFFLCWCCKCGCDDLVDDKVKSIADKIIKEASLSQASQPASPLPATSKTKK